MGEHHLNISEEELLEELSAFVESTDYAEEMQEGDITREMIEKRLGLSRWQAYAFMDKMEKQEGWVRANVRMPGGGVGRVLRKVRG